MKQLKTNSKGPDIIKVDKQLDKHLQQNLFKEKLDKANKILATSKLPSFK